MTVEARYQRGLRLRPKSSIPGHRTGITSPEMRRAISSAGRQVIGRHIISRPQEGETYGQTYVSEQNVFRPQTKEKPLPVSEVKDQERKISMTLFDVVPGCNTQGDLGVVLEIEGLGLRAEFIKAQGDYGPDSSAYYTEAEFDGEIRRLVLRTLGDVIEAQVVLNKVDEGILKKDEFLVPDLLTEFDPATMNKPKVRGNWVVLTYGKRQTK